MPTTCSPVSPVPSSSAESRERTQTVATVRQAAAVFQLLREQHEPHTFVDDRSFGPGAGLLCKCLCVQELAIEVGGQQRTRDRGDRRRERSPGGRTGGRTRHQGHQDCQGRSPARRTPAACRRVRTRSHHPHLQGRIYPAQPAGRRKCRVRPAFADSSRHARRFGPGE